MIKRRKKSTDESDGVITNNLQKMAKAFEILNDGYHAHNLADDNAYIDQLDSDTKSEIQVAAEIPVEQDDGETSKFSEGDLIKAFSLPVIFGLWVVLFVVGFFLGKARSIDYTTGRNIKAVILNSYKCVQVFDERILKKVDQTFTKDVDTVWREAVEESFE